MKPLTVTDLDFVARTVMAEAEAEPYIGKVAVAAVIYNRAKNPAWWGVSAKDVCLTAKQFSCWNDNNPRRNHIGEWDMESKTYRECFRAAIDGYDNDPTDGADSYFAHAIVSPSWANGLKGKIIGRHSFFRVMP